MAQLFANTINSSFNILNNAIRVFILYFHLKQFFDTTNAFFMQSYFVIQKYSLEVLVSCNKIIKNN